MNFTDKQIEYIKNASDHVEMLCGGRGQGKTHQLINEMQDKINDLQSKIDKVIEFIKESNTYYEITHYIPEDEKQFKINMETLTNHLLDILKEDK